MPCARETSDKNSCSPGIAAEELDSAGDEPQGCGGDQLGGLASLVPFCPPLEVSCCSSVHWVLSLLPVFLLHFVWKVILCISSSCKKGQPSLLQISITKTVCVLPGLQGPHRAPGFSCTWMESWGPRAALLSSVTGRLSKEYQTFLELQKLLQPDLGFNLQLCRERNLFLCSRSRLGPAGLCGSLLGVPCLWIIPTIGHLMPSP